MNGLMLLLSSHPTPCPLDPIPSHLLQAISPSLLPALTHIINTYLSNRHIPQCVTPWCHHRGTKSLSRTFSFIVPDWWNELLTAIRNTGSLTIFISTPENSSLPSSLDFVLKKNYKCTLTFVCHHLYYLCC